MGATNARNQGFASFAERIAQLQVDSTRMSRMASDDLLFALIAAGSALALFDFLALWLTWRSDQASKLKALLSLQALYKLSIQRPLQLARQARVKSRSSGGPRAL